MRVFLGCQFGLEIARCVGATKRGRTEADDPSGLSCDRGLLGARRGRTLRLIEPGIDLWRPKEAATTAIGVERFALADLDRCRSRHFGRRCRHRRRRRSRHPGGIKAAKILVAEGRPAASSERLHLTPRSPQSLHFNDPRTH